jgi:hypothetical protein
VKALKKMAKMNGKREPKTSDLVPILQSCHKHHSRGTEDERNSNPPSTTSFSNKVKGIAINIKSLVDTREACKRTLTIWALFIIVAFVYYGFAFSTNLTSNPYILVALG